MEAYQGFLVTADQADRLLKPAAFLPSYEGGDYINNKVAEYMSKLF